MYKTIYCLIIGLLIGGISMFLITKRCVNNEQQRTITELSNTISTLELGEIETRRLILGAGNTIIEYERIIREREDTIKSRDIELSEYEEILRRVKIGSRNTDEIYINFGYLIEELGNRDF